MVEKVAVVNFLVSGATRNLVVSRYGFDKISAAFFLLLQAVAFPEAAVVIALNGLVSGRAFKAFDRDGTVIRFNLDA